MRMRWSLIVLSVLAWCCVVARAQGSGDLSGRWRINGNGYSGDLVISQGTDGLLSGSMYGNPISGFMAAGARQAVILRGPAAAPDQVYVATLAADERTMSGNFFAFNTVNGGASAERNVFAFRAQRGTSATPSSPGPLPYTGIGAPPKRIVGTYQIVGNGLRGPLRIDSQAADGAVRGIVYTESLTGHYAHATGTVAFFRMLNGAPFQVFVGTATGQSPPRLSGTFYPLNAAGGATRQKVQYEWSTGAAPPSHNSIMVPPSSAGDVELLRHSLSCDGLVVRVYYGDTGSHVDVAPGQARAIRINQEPASTPIRVIRWECRDPGQAAVANTTFCPGMAAAGGNSNVARVVRTDGGESRLDCLFRRSMP